MGHAISFDGSGEVIDCAPGETLLHAALRHGLAFPYECGSGSCGTCVFQTISGEYESLWPGAPGLSDRARRKGDRMLACQTRARSDGVVRVAFEDRCRPPVPPVQVRVRLNAVGHLTHDMWQFTLTADAPARFMPGQFALLSIDGVEGARAYSMSNLANEAGAWDFIIRRKPGGALSDRLFERARVGDTVDLSGPYGMAYLAPQMRNIWCIAGGSGLSPALSIARGALADGQGSARVDLFYGGRGPADMIELGLFADLADHDDRLRFHPSMSEAEASWEGATGFVHELVEAHAARIAEDAELFIAGPPVMIRATLSMLEANGIPRERIHYDSFY